MLFAVLATGELSEKLSSILYTFYVVGIFLKLFSMGEIPHLLTYNHFNIKYNLRKRKLWGSSLIKIYEKNIQKQIQNQLDKIILQ